MHLPSIVDGDDHISPFESKLWSVVFHCMMKYSCPIMFKHHRGYPDKKNKCMR